MPQLRIRAGPLASPTGPAGSRPGRLPGAALQRGIAGWRTPPAVRRPRMAVPQSVSPRRLAETDTGAVTVGEIDSEEICTRSLRAIVREAAGRTPWSRARRGSLRESPHQASLGPNSAHRCRSAQLASKASPQTDKAWGGMRCAATPVERREAVLPLVAARSGVWLMANLSTGACGRDRTNCRGVAHTQDSKQLRISTAKLVKA
jgi:hypothetical protein